MSGTWTWTTTATPASGRVRTDDLAVWATATSLLIAEATANGTDTAAALAALSAGDIVRLQDAADATQWARYTITAAGTDAGIYYTIPLEFIDGNGVPPANNRDTLVSFKTAGGSGGGGGTPADTVVAETTFGQSSAVGTGTEYAREDHTHGTPTDPVPAHVAAADPHTQYQKESEKSAASGYASLDSTTRVPAAELATGTPDGTKFLRDDRSWQALPAPGTPGHTIQEEGSALTVRAGLNFVGDGVSATDDSGNDRTNVTIPERLPTGGTTGQVLTKTSATDYATAWQAAASAISWEDVGTTATLAAGHTIADEGVALTARPTLDFAGAGVTATDDASGSKTVVTIPGGGGDMVKIAEAVLVSSQAYIEFTSIPQTYKHLKVIAWIRDDVAQSIGGLRMRINGDAQATSYWYVLHYAIASGGNAASGTSGGDSSGQVALSAGANAVADIFAEAEILLANYAATSGYKGWLSASVCNAALQASLLYRQVYGGLFAAGQAAITSLRFFPSSGNLVAGSTIQLYGVK